MHESDLDSIERPLTPSEIFSTRAADVDPSIQNTNEYSSVLATTTATTSELRVNAPATLKLPIFENEIELLVSRLQGSIDRKQLPPHIQDLSKKRFILLKKPNSATTMLAVVTGSRQRKVAADCLEMDDLRRILSINDIACMLIQLHRTNPFKTMKQLHHAVTLSYRCWPEQITKAFFDRPNDPSHPSPLMRDAPMVVDDDDDVKSVNIKQQLSSPSSASSIGGELSFDQDEVDEPFEGNMDDIHSELNEGSEENGQTDSLSPPPQLPPINQSLRPFPVQEQEHMQMLSELNQLPNDIDQERKRLNDQIDGLKKKLLSTQSYCKELDTKHNLLVVSTTSEIECLKQSVKQSNANLERERQRASLLGSEIDQTRASLAKKLSDCEKKLSEASQSNSQLTQKSNDLQLLLTESQTSLTKTQEELDKANEAIKAHQSAIGPKRFNSAEHRQSILDNINQQINELNTQLQHLLIQLSNESENDSSEQSLSHFNWTQLLSPIKALDWSETIAECFVNNFRIVESAKTVFQAVEDFMNVECEMRMEQEEERLKQGLKQDELRAAEMKRESEEAERKAEEAERKAEQEARQAAEQKQKYLELKRKIKSDSQTIVMKKRRLSEM